MSCTQELNAALLEHKGRLMAALGRHQAAYLRNLKLWFRQKWTKEEFDRESRKLLGAGTVALHNRFFVALLNKVDPMMEQRPPANPQQQHTQVADRGHCVVAPPATDPPLHQNDSSSITTETTASTNDSSAVDFVVPTTQPISVKRRKRNYSDSSHPRFAAADLYEYYTPTNAELPAPDQSTAATQLPTSPTRALSPPRFAAQELFLPDIGMVLGRLLCGAWESGLATADDEVAEMIVQAVQNLLKNILTAVLLHRKDCRVSGNTGDFVYDIGAPFADPTLRTSLVRRAAPIDDAPMEVDRTISSMSLVRPDKRDDVLFASACELMQLESRPKRVNLLDLYRTLSDDRQLIPVHSVLTVNVERMSQMLH